jgi:hypothetical protein
MNIHFNMPVRPLLLLAAVALSSACSAPGDAVDDSTLPGDIESVDTLEEPIAEAVCYTEAPNATLSPSGAGIAQSNQSPTVYGTPIGQPGCSLAWKLRMRPTGVVRSRLQVRTTVAPSAAECTRTAVRAIVYRNGVFQRDMTTLGTLSGGVCNRPSVGDVFSFGDGADWRVIVQARVQFSTRSVTTTLTNQQQ